MKNLLLALALAMAATSITTANASDFFGSNSGEWKMGPNGPYWDENDWPEWTPMYWMEEFMNSWDDNNNWGGNSFGFGNNNYGYGVPYGASPYGYGQAPYGYAAPYGGYGYGYPQYPQVPVAPVVPAPAVPVQ